MFSAEFAHSIAGVSGRMYPRHIRPDAPHLFSAQKWISEARDIAGYHIPAIIRVEIRFDDSCKNGNATFAITADIRRKDGRGHDNGWLAGRCAHDDIAAIFPELAHLIRWHLCSTDSPMHYIANTLYHAGDRDHNGLREGETRQIINGRTKLPCWKLEGLPDYSGRTFDGLESELPAVPVPHWAPWNRVGEGKARDLDAARRTAIWPDATDEELTAPPAELRAKLEERHPALIAAFRGDMESAGLLWSPVD